MPDMSIVVNGDPMKVSEGLSVSELLRDLQIKDSRVAVEVNLDIIRSAQRDARKLQAGDKVEIVSFVGGGA